MLMGYVSNVFDENAMKNRFKRINYLIIAVVFFYCTYRFYEVFSGGGEVFGDKILTLVWFGSACILSVWVLQRFALFLKWQPLIVSMLLFTAATAGAVIDGEFGLYFNILTLVSIFAAFYLNPRNYLWYFVASSTAITILVFGDIINLSEKDGVIYSSATLLAWLFFEIKTLGILILVIIVRKSIDRVERRDKISLDLLARAGELRDNDTGNHLLRTTYYAGIIIADLVKNPHKDYPLAEGEGSLIIDAVKLHDIGKIAVSDAILYKPGKLSDEEFEHIKTHAEQGAKMFEGAAKLMNEQDILLSTAYNIAYGHHEKWDGSGYPRALSGFNIPLSARVAAIADVFDALTTERPYKKAFPPREAFDILYKDAGSHFDPYLIEIVKRHESEFIEISEKFKTEKNEQAVKI